MGTVRKIKKIDDIKWMGEVKGIIKLGRADWGGRRIRKEDGFSLSPLVSSSSRRYKEDGAHAFRFTPVSCQRALLAFPPRPGPWGIRVRIRMRILRLRLDL